MVPQLLKYEERTLRRGLIAAGVTAGAWLLLIAPAGAFDFQSSDGELKGSLDTTIGYGQAWRMRKPNLALIGIADGGTGQSPNFDNGDLNYRKGDAFSKAFRGLTELSLKYHDYGLFTRVSALYDMAVMDDETARTPISDSAKVVAGSYVRLLDAFVYGKWHLGEQHPLELRLGKQVLSWGESTFIASPFTNVNAIDVAALRSPDAELKQAFLPQAMALMSLGLTQNLSLEAFYQFQWIQTDPEPVGTYFSTNDFVPRGGSQVFLGFGQLSDQGTDFRSLGGPYIRNFQAVGRDPDQDPRKGGQYGAALRWFMPDLGTGTEFGLQYVNYHSHLPLVSARTGTQTGIGNAAGAATAAGAAAQLIASGLSYQAAVGTASVAGAQAAAAAGGNLSTAGAAPYASIGANLALLGGSQQAITAEATALAQHEYAQTSSYFIQYPEDVHALGLSFSTQVGTSGVALQGELSYAYDVPLQYDDVEVLFAALTPLEQALFPLSAPPGATFPSTCTPLAPTATRCGQLGAFGPNQLIQGWGRYKEWQYQMTATTALPTILRATQILMVTEAGVTYIPNLPSQSSGGPNGRGLRFESTGTFVSGNAALAGLQNGVVEPASAFPTATSWGYRVLLKADYDGLIGAWNVSPRLFFAQDVHGTTPGPGGNFLEGRTAFTAGVAGTLRNTYQLDLSYTHFSGAGHYNLLGDRDFLAASVKVSF
jgi:hypothetical protein